MDPDGLAIATEASRLSNLIGGPPIRPAKRLWSAMADVPVQSQGNIEWSREKTGQAWLGDDLALRLKGVRAARGTKVDRSRHYRRAQRTDDARSTCCCGLINNSGYPSLIASTLI
jgi:hypothetical protein